MGSSLSAVAGAVNDGHISVTSSPISTVEELYGFTNLTPRHGSIMHISQSEYNALVAASGGVTDNDIMFNFTRSYSHSPSGWDYTTYTDSNLRDVNIMFKENGSSAKVAHDAGYITLKNATMFVNDETVRAMFPDDVYTVSFDYSLESTTNLSAPIFALGTGSGAPEVNTDYVMVFGNGDIWVRKSGENSDTFVANKALRLGATYHYDIVSDGTNIKFYRDGNLIGNIAATVDFPTSGTRYASFGFTDGHSSYGYGYGSYSRIRFRDEAVSAKTIKTESSKALLYQNDSGTETIDGKDNALNVSHNGNHNIAEPITSRISSSYTLSGWVNPGASVDYNSVIMSIGSGKWSPGPSGRYLAIREDGTILFNYCSGSNSGGNWSQHYVDINSAFSLSTNTWAYLQVNIVPISDNQVKFVVFKDGVQTLAQDITLTTKVDDNDTNGNDYAYGMLGMLQLTTNNIYLGRLEVPSWWQNENGTTYVKDVRFYSQAIDPDNLYAAAVAREYVDANLPAYSTSASANSYNKAAHFGAEIPTSSSKAVFTGDDAYFNNIVYAADSQSSVENVDWNSSNLAFAIPTGTVMVYDGVKQPSMPVACGYKKKSGNYGVYYCYLSNCPFELKGVWLGYYNWGSTYTLMNTNATMAYAYGTSNSTGNQTNTGTTRLWANKMFYTGNFSGNTTYFDEITSVTFNMATTRNSKYNDPCVNERTGSNFVINYKPIYDILKSSGATAVPNESSYTLATLYDEVSSNEDSYTTSSVEDFYVAAYKVLSSNPNKFSYSDVAAGVKDCAAHIKDAVFAFNAIDLVPRADFSELDERCELANGIIDTLGTDSQDYTANSINALATVMSGLTYYNVDAATRADMDAQTYQSDIDDEADTVSDAIDALVAKKTVTFVEFGGTSTTVKFDQDVATAADVEAAAPALPANSYDSASNKHYTYAWDNAFAAPTSNATYTQIKSEVPHSYSSYEHIGSTSTHSASCSVNGQSHTDTLACEYETEFFEATATTNSFTRYTCKYCDYSYDADYGAQNWTAYDNAVAAYDAKAAEEDFAAKYTAASREAFEAAASSKLEKVNTHSQTAIDNATTALNNAVDGLAIQNYTITYKYWGVATKETAVLPYGASAEDVAAYAPENTATNYDETRHYTFAWETFAAVTGNKTYIELRTSTAHSYNAVHTDADGDANGFTTYTCACGHSYVEYDTTNWNAYDTAVAAYDAADDEEDFAVKYTAASREAYASAAENKLTKADTVSQSAINAATTALENAVSGLVALADYSALDAAITAGNAKIAELESGSTLYTESSVTALVQAVEAAQAARQTEYTSEQQDTVDAFTSDVYSAIDGLSTEPVIDPTADEDVVDNYEAAIDRIKNLDTDMYDLGGSTIEDILEFCISTAAEENESNITTIDVLDDDALEAITAACLAQLQSMVKLYTINVSGDLDNECPVVSIFTGELQTVEAGKKYKVKANTRVLFNASSKATAWYMSYSIDGVDRRSRQYQGKGAAIELPVVGDIDIDAVQETADAPNMVTINRTYSDNTESKYVIQCVEFTKDTYTLPAAPALPFYEFANYTYGENVYEAGDEITGISEDIVVKANYTFIGTANEYAVNITSTTEEELYSSSVSYNTKVEVYDASAYAWVTNQGKLFYIGSELTFFVAESVTLEAITYEEFIAAEYTTPAVSTRSEALLTEGKITINSQVVTQSSDKVLEYGVLVGIAKPSGSISTEDLTILNTNTTHDDYVLIRAKSTKMFGANQFTIGINTNNKGTYLYRVYAIYDIGNNMTRTVYSDVKTVEMT
jgi:hypothetical protein